MTGALVNTSRAVSVRLVIPWRGAWFVDVDVDPDDPSAPLTGAATVTVGGGALKGTVDPRASGRFVDTVRARIVGGGGGWDKPVSRQHFHADAGVSSTQVYGSTASQVGETVREASPASLGTDVVRSAGPASRVLEEVDWYVDLEGVTQIATRTSATPDKSVEILSYDPRLNLLEVSADAIILPGTEFTDPRFDGTLIVRDVEQTFTKEGSRAQLWCGPAVSRLASVFANAVRELAGTTWLRLHEYRYVSADGARLKLQAVNKAEGLPDVLPVDVWPGMAGLSAKLTPSQSVVVAFLNGDPKRPRVVSFDGNLPVEASLDAKTAVHIGATATRVDLCGGGPPIARQGDIVKSFLPPSLVVTGTVSGNPFTGTITVANPISGVIIGGSAKGSCGP